MKHLSKKRAKHGTSAESTLYNGAFTLEGWDGTEILGPKGRIKIIGTKPMFR